MKKKSQNVDLGLGTALSMPIILTVTKELLICFSGASHYEEVGGMNKSSFLS